MRDGAVDALKQGRIVERFGHGALLRIIQRLLTLDSAGRAGTRLIEQRGVAVRIAPLSARQTGDRGAHLQQVDRRPNAPLFNAKLEEDLDLGGCEQARFRGVSHVGRKGGELLDAFQSVDAINLRLHYTLDALDRLAVLDADPTVNLNDRDRTVVVHQCPRRAAAISRIARAATVSSATVRDSDPSGSASRTFAALTRVEPGIERSARISRKTDTGSHAATSTPSNAFAEASARDGRPPFRLGFLGLQPGRLPFAQPSNCLLRVSSTSSVRAESARDEARG
jgi:hypothetical protein